MARLRLNLDETHFLIIPAVNRASELFSCIDENRQHLSVWLPWLEDVTVVSHSRRFLSDNLASYRAGLGFSFAIMEGIRICGMVGFHGFDQKNLVTSLGYWLTERDQGKGLMSLAVSRCIDYAMTERRMNRLYVRCATGNERSKAIPQRLGFTCEGIQREAEWLYDHFVDLEVYSMLAKEWG